MKSFLLLLLAYTAIFFLPACKKEYSYEGGPLTNSINDSAIFTLDGYPNSCTNITVTGNYVVGVKLSATNNITIKVTVTKTGSYSISTSLVNGIQFKGSGIFNQLGSQDVVLQGSGTPLSKSVNTVLINSGNSYCSFTLSVQDTAPVDFTLDAWEFTQDTKTFRGYFDGALTNIVNGNTILTLVGLTPTQDTAIAILVDIVGSSVKTGTYKSLTTSSFTFFDNRGNGIFLADKTSRSVELTVVITSFDAATQIIAGTFSGTAVNASGQPVPITEGKFRAKLNR